MTTHRLTGVRLWALPVLVLPVVLFGCGPSTRGDPGESGAGTTMAEGETSTTDTNTDLSIETAGSGCTPSACSQTCGSQSSECGEPLEGACIDGETCGCTPPTECPLCIEEKCAVYETCSSEFGFCVVSCDTTIPFPVDSPQACIFSLVGYPPAILPYTQVVDGGETLPWVSSCDDVDAGERAWTRSPEEDAVILCEETCLALLDGAPIVFVVGCPPY